MVTPGKKDIEAQEISEEQLHEIVRIGAGSDCEENVSRWPLEPSRNAEGEAVSRTDEIDLTAVNGSMLW